jgi:hypothetical protein
VRTHPDANAPGDRTASHAVAQVLREQHNVSLAHRLPAPARTRCFWTPNVLSLAATCLHWPTTLTPPTREHGSAGVGLPTFHRQHSISWLQSNHLSPGIGTTS